MRFAQHSTFHRLQISRTVHPTPPSISNTPPWLHLHSELHTPRAPHTLPTLQNSHSTNLHNTLHCPRTALHTLHTPHPLHFLHTPYTLCTLCAPHTLFTLYAVLHTLHILHNLHTLHCAHSAPLHTHAHFTLYTSALEFVYKWRHLQTLHSILFALHTPRIICHTPHSRLQTLHSTFHIPLRTHTHTYTHHHTPPSALDPLHITWLPTLRTTKLHTPYSAHLALHTALPTLHILHFALHAPSTWQSTIQTRDFIRYTANLRNSTLYTLDCDLGTPHSTCHTSPCTFYFSRRARHTPQSRRATRYKPRPALCNRHAIDTQSTRNRLHSLQSRRHRASHSTHFILDAHCALHTTKLSTLHIGHSALHTTKLSTHNPGQRWVDLEDSTHRLFDFQAYALDNWTTLFVNLGKTTFRRQD